MISEFVCFKCKCEKCGHGWTTKAHVIPIRCAKCNSVRWNEGSDPFIDSVPETSMVEPRIEDPQTKLERARAALLSAETKPQVQVSDEIDEWAGWGKEEQTYDDQTGDIRTYRKHIKTGSVRWIEVERYLG